MVALIREAGREPVPAVAKRDWLSEQTIHTWRKRFGAFQADDVRRHKPLNHENARLKNRVWRICQIAFNSDPFSSPVAAPLSWVGWGYPCSALEGHGRRHAFHRAGDARADQGLLA
jgi:hypothetical protein